MSSEIRGASSSVKVHQSPHSLRITVNFAGLGHLAKKATSLSIPLTSLKFAPVIAIAYSTTRTKDWDDILTAHAEETFARTWTMKDKKLGKRVFGFGDGGKKGASVGAVTVSSTSFFHACSLNCT